MNILEKPKYWKDPIYRKTYRAWADMKDRCNNGNNPRAKDYKRRGIKYCLKWSLFEGFLEDMGIAPEGKSLDRIDNNGNYSKENCRWATNTEQFNNRRTCHYITFAGFTKTRQEWIRFLGINKPHVLRHRLRLGWSFSRAISTPVGASISVVRISK